jgi:hypothetical protein
VTDTPAAINSKEIKSLTEFVRLKAPTIFIMDAHPNLVKEVQSLLKIEADGLIGPVTKQVFSEFKTLNQLQYPLALGLSTAQELLDLKDKEETEATQEDPLSLDLKLNPDAGSPTGPIMTLPDGKIVYANQYIVEGVPLTWGEATKNCTRVPTSAEYVANAIQVAKTWGPVREKFGSPIKITSGYRPPAVNSSVGGARNSQHLYFRAIDMIPINGDFKKLWEVLKSSNFSGLGDAVFMGKNKGFFHADVRPGGRVVFPY